MRWRARVGERCHEVALVNKPGRAVHAQVDGRRYELDVSQPHEGVFSLLIDGNSHEAIVQVRRGICRVRLGGSVFEVVPDQPGRRDRDGGASQDGPVGVRAVMPGRIVRILVKPGETVEPRQGLVVIEAMKMENELTAPRRAVVRDVRISVGDRVETGDTLILLD